MTSPVAVMQGWGDDLTWKDLNEAAIAIHRGRTLGGHQHRPDAADRPRHRARQRRGRGRRPDGGDASPEVAGKPYRPLLDETVQRLGRRRPIFVGDRLDTDIAGAVDAGLDSMLVLTGRTPWSICWPRIRAAGRPISATTCAICSTRPDRRGPDRRARARSAAERRPPRLDGGIMR